VVSSFPPRCSTKASRRGIDEYDWDEVEQRAFVLRTPPPVATSVSSSHHFTHASVTITAGGWEVVNTDASAWEDI
jgi:hypothetical protein